VRRGRRAVSPLWIQAPRCPVSAARLLKGIPSRNQPGRRNRLQGPVLSAISSGNALPLALHEWCRFLPVSDTMVKDATGFWMFPSKIPSKPPRGPEVSLGKASLSAIFNRCSMIIIKLEKETRHYEL
ncbi:hypothetical protein AVEN_227635-1, partial [Araneus ventricosus]